MPQPSLARPTPPLRARAALAALVVAMGAVAGTRAVPVLHADEGGVVVKDEKNDFQWTLPEGWKTQPVSEADKSQGYFAKARREVAKGLDCYANVLVQETGGNDLDAFFSQMKENKEKALAEVESSDDTVTWAGTTTARSLTVMGRADNGSTVKWFVRAAVVGTRYHQVSVVSYNGAYQDIQSEVDAVLDAYVVLSAPPPDGDAPAGEGDGARRPIVRRFEQLGLTWTLPPGGKKTLPPVKDDEPERVWEWGFVNAGNPNMKRGETGLVASAVLNFNGETVLRLELELPQASADVDPKAIVRNERNFDGLKNNFEGSAIPGIDDDARVGNARGAYFGLSGKSARTGKPLFIRFYFVTLQQQPFQLRVIADDRAEQTEADFLRAATHGLVWADASTGIRGPIAAPFPTSTAQRKEWRDFGTEKRLESPLKLKKPKEFGSLSLQNAGGYVYAAEARKPGAYLFVGIVRENSERIGKGTPPWTMQSIIDELENEWKSSVDDPVTRGKGDKTNSKDGALKNGKGHVYEFRGTKDGNPFVEKGWVLRVGKDVFWIRAQFGGADAMKALDKEFKSLLNSIAFN